MDSAQTNIEIQSLLFTCVEYARQYTVIVNFRKTIFNSSQRLTVEMNFNAKNIASIKIT